MLRRAMNGRIVGALAVGLLGCGGCGSTIDDLFCADEGCAWGPGEWERLQTLTGLRAPPPDPSNRYAADPAVARLGQRLFFDPGFAGRARQIDSLRRPTTVGRAPVDQPLRLGCFSCHDLDRGGIDTSSLPGNVSIGAGVTDVNAPPAINAAQHRVQFWNGRVTSLWALNVVVGESEITMNGTRLQTLREVARRYGDEVDALFGAVLPPGWRDRAARLPPEGKPGRMAGCQPGEASEPAGDSYDCLGEDDQRLATMVYVLWAKALAAYESRLASDDSPFDRFMRQGPRSTLISERAKHGARLFVGKAGCLDCHNGPLLSDDDFHDVGVPQSGPGVPTEAECPAGADCDCVSGRACLPWGAYNGVAWQTDVGARAVGLIEQYADGPPPGAVPAHAADELKGAWRTPSLRDVALTAPYMHDGVYATLEEVLWHYNTGGRGVRAAAVGTPSAKLKPLGLAADEVADLIEFLRTLTGAPLPADLRGLPR
jgi:cytochrome c peroxidase